METRRPGLSLGMGYLQLFLDATPKKYLGFLTMVEGGEVNFHYFQKFKQFSKKYLWPNNVKSFLGCSLIDDPTLEI